MTDKPDPEVTALKQRVDELTDMLADVRAEQQRRNQELVETLRSFGFSAEQIEGAVRRGMDHGMTRRAALLGIVATVGGAGYIAGTENAQAAPTGQQGTAASPIDIIYADEIGQSGDEVTKIFTQSVDAGTVTADSLVIGGTLYEEDANSPFTPSTTSSSTYTVSGTYDEVIVLPQRDNIGFNQLRVNGDSAANYDYTDNSDTETTGQNEFALGEFTGWMKQFSLVLNTSSGRIGLNTEWARSGTGLTAYGLNNANKTSIDSFTVIDSAGSNRSLNARVLGRVMDI